MAPINFEDKIREKLEKRRIEPSAGSWNKLEVKLKREQTGKARKTKWWLAVAAVLVLGLFAGSIFFRTPVQGPQVADQPAQDLPKETPSENAQFKTKQQLAVEEEKSETEKDEIENPNPAPSVKDTNEAVAEVVSEEKPRKISAPVQVHFQEKKASVLDNFSNNIAQSQFAKVEEPGANGAGEDEIEALLARATQEISKENNFRRKAQVNSAELLSDVETELEHSFRKKVFEMLKEGYIKAKTSVATRND